MDESLRHRVQRRPYTKIMHWYRNTDTYIPLFNEAIRVTMRLKYRWDQYRVTRHSSGHEKRIEEWFEKRPIFFGFASFRSGTVALTNLLKTELSNADIEHEANVDDYWDYPQVLADPLEAINYIGHFRLNEIYFRARRDCEIYGEINPYLRLHCKAIKDLLPHAKLFHIIRDGRDVVRSIMSREILGKKDPLKDLIHPPNKDPYSEKWPEMNRFERICWQWQYDNRFVRESVPHCIHFEDMLSDYDYFNHKISDYLNVEISEMAWRNAFGSRKNVTPSYQIASWKEWDKAQLAAFESICGDEMGMYGYQ